MLEPLPVDNNILPQPINNQPSGLNIPKKCSKLKIILIGFSVLFLLAGIFLAIAYFWYESQLKPVGSDKSVLKLVKIEKNSTLDQIGDQLQSESIIKNSLAFKFYAKISKKGGSLQAGTYRLSPSESTPQIIGHLVSGKIAKFNITFYPGATLVDNITKDKSKRIDVTTVLEKAGYPASEIKSALSDSYSSPLFAGKPATADLEGYIYGETYEFTTGTTVHDILQRTFDEFYAKVQENNLTQLYASHGLSLYQGITLASIVQKEVNSADDQKQVAQVFYLRQKNDTVLGSDVTYQYIADKTDVVRDINLDSPYNTRKYKGLPPGPISAPGLTALLAVAQPASGDYMYFLSGDDDVTYFSRTEAEHEANIQSHCQVKCATQ